MVLEKESDALMVLRRVGNQKQRRVIQRDRRPHLLAEAVEFIAGDEVLVISFFQKNVYSINLSCSIILTMQFWI